VTRGQCDARPTVTFPAAGHHRLLTGIKLGLYCLVREARACEQLAQGCYRYPKVERAGVVVAIFRVASLQTLTITLIYTTRPQELQ